MIQFLTKPKLVILLLGAGVALSLLIISLQIHLTGVSAQIIPVLVSVDDLDFGTVFPGEQRQGDFVVSISPEYQGDGVNYRIIQKRKPLPPEHPEYPDGGDPQMPGYYRNLCPHLTKVTTEGEGDTESSAFVGPNDTSDAWIIYFQVPAIFGNVGQDHIGGVVTESGEYGCDVSIDIDLAQLCDPNQELVTNGSFETPIVTHTKKWYIYNSAAVDWTVEWTTAITTFGGYSIPAEGLLELHRGVNGWLPKVGSQYAELDSDWYGPDVALNNEPASVRIYQNIATLPGQTYQVKFYFSPRPNTTAGDNILQVIINGETKPLISTSGSSNTVWTEYSYTFTATGSTTRIQFTDLGIANSTGTFIDGVSVRCQPQ